MTHCVKAELVVIPYLTIPRASVEVSPRSHCVKGELVFIPYLNIPGASVEVSPSDPLCKGGTSCHSILEHPSAIC